jgi:hypothetical protein
MDPDATPVEANPNTAEEAPAEELEAEDLEVVEKSPDDAPEEEIAADAPPPLPSAPPPPLPPSTLASEVQTSGMAIASLVMGIVGWTILPLIGSVLAIIFGYMARSEIRQRPDELTGEGLAVAGLVLGWLMVGVSVLLLCLGGLGMCFFFAVAGSSGY